MQLHQSIHTDRAPKALGPYSQGVILSNFSRLLFVSGQLPIDPQTQQMVEGDIEKQTVQVIDNLEAILKEAGSSLHCVLRVDIFLKDLARDFARVNAIYAKRFTGEHPPARQTVQVSELPKGSPIEISCIAYVR